MFTIFVRVCKPIVLSENYWCSLTSLNITNEQLLS